MGKKPVGITFNNFFWEIIDLKKNLDLDILNFKAISYEKKILRKFKKNMASLSGQFKHRIDD